MQYFGLVWNWWAINKARRCSHGMRCKHKLCSGNFTLAMMLVPCLIQQRESLCKTKDQSLTKMEGSSHHPRDGEDPQEGHIKTAVKEARGWWVEVCGFRVEIKRDIMFTDPAGAVYLLKGSIKRAEAWKGRSALFPLTRRCPKGAHRRCSDYLVYFSLCLSLFGFFVSILILGHIANMNLHLFFCLNCWTIIENQSPMLAL